MSELAITAETWPPRQLLVEVLAQAIAIFEETWPPADRALPDDATAQVLEAMIWTRQREAMLAELLAFVRVAPAQPQRLLVRRLQLLADRLRSVAAATSTAILERRSEGSS